MEREIAGKPTPDEYNNGINRAYSIVREVAEEYNGEWTNCSVFVEILKDKMMNDRQLGRKSLEAILSDIEQAELEYAGGWIPCIERLPEENQEVMLQDFYGNITIEKMKTNDGAKGFSCGDWWSSANNYVAWHPLPAPYKEKENNIE